MYGEKQSIGGVTPEIGYYTPPNAIAEREPEVPQQLRELYAAVEATHKAAMALCERLAPVSRMNETAAGTDKPHPQQVLCGLADQIRNMRTAIDQTRNLLDSQRNRLEI